MTDLRDDEDVGPFGPTSPPDEGAFATSPILDAKWLIDLHGPDALKSTPPPRKWLLSRVDESRGRLGWLPLGVPAVFYGAGGAGKSTAAVQLAMSIAAGRSWLGFGCNAGAVVLVLAEEDQEEIDRRLHNAYLQLQLTEIERAMAASRIMPISLIGHSAKLLVRNRAGLLSETQVFEHLRDRLAHIQCDIRAIIIDPLSHFAPAEAEVDNGTAADFMCTLTKLTRVRGNPTVIAVHHVGKTERDGKPSINAARGAGALTDNARFALHMVEDAQTGTITLASTKSNYSAKGPHVPLVRDHRGLLRRMTVEEEAERGSVH